LEQFAKISNIYQFVDFFSKAQKNNFKLTIKSTGK